MMANETRRCLDLIEQGVVPVEDLVSHRLPLDDVGDGIRRTAEASDEWLRAVVLPQGSSSCAN